MQDTNDTTHDLWREVNQARLDIAELRGMVKMHFDDRSHHVPPCQHVADMQRTIMSALAAAVLAVLSSVGNLVMTVIK